ncbi:MAG: carbohydrate binding domain-containing protein [Firmicutes bacterium]|nr:carbohydrate binding domain-containing protein [Bacillota bacterium]
MKFLKMPLALFLCITFLSMLFVFAAEVNQIPEGDFENGSGSVEVRSCAISVTDKEAKTGSHSLMVTREVGWGRPVRKVNIKRGEVYGASVWIKRDGIAQQAALRLDFGEGIQPRYVFLAQKSVSRDWVLLQGNTKISLDLEAESMDVMLDVAFGNDTPPDTFYIDDLKFVEGGIELQKVSEPEPPAQPSPPESPNADKADGTISENLIKDGDFEGSAGEWFGIGGGEISLTTAHITKGINALKVERKDPWSRAGRPFTVKRGMTYGASVWVKIEEGALQQGFIRFDMGAGVQPRYIAFGQKGVSTSWVQVMGTAKIPDTLETETAEVILEFAFANNTEAVPYYLDDVNLYEGGLPVVNAAVATEDIIKEVEAKLEINSGDRALYRNFSLPAFGPGGTTIKWRSDLPEALDMIDGMCYINRPAPGSAPLKVKITAEITNKDITVEKNFECSVMPMRHPSAFYVSKDGSDENLGGPLSPFKTINKAAQIADAGDKVIIGGGVYRERVSPKRGGLSEDTRVTYTAAEGEQVIIKGSEELTTFERQREGVYKSALPVEAFGDYNPYTQKFMAFAGQTLGELFVDGEPYAEAVSEEAVATTPKSWKANKEGTEIYFNIGQLDPSQALVEVNARETVFCPEVYNLGYITVQNIEIEHAANQYPLKFWEAGGGYQRGALSTNGGHHWIIENCSVKYAKGNNIDFGLSSQQLMEDAKYLYGGNVAEKMGQVGYHIIRNNFVYGGGTGGIQGMWGPFTKITGNRIINNNRLNAVAGYEAGGLKTHYFLSGIIADNYFSGNKYAGCWLDNVAEGVLITGNVFVDEPDTGLFLEMPLGSISVNSNVFLNSNIMHSDGGGVKLANNFINSNAMPHFRFISTHTSGNYAPGSWAQAGIAGTRLAEIQYAKNYFVGKGLSLPLEGENILNNFAFNNLYTNGAVKSDDEPDAVVSSQKTEFSYEKTNEGVTLKLTPSADVFNAGTALPDIFYAANPSNGSPYYDVSDFFGNPFTNQSIVGAFADLKAGENTITLYPKPQRDISNYAVPFINNNNVSIEYSSGYKRLENRLLGDYGGDVHQATANGESFSFSFRGTGFELYGERGPDAPELSVEIDGEASHTFMPVSETSIYGASWYVSDELSYGSHTVKVTKTGGGNANFDGYYRRDVTLPASLNENICMVIGSPKIYIDGVRNSILRDNDQLVPILKDEKTYIPLKAMGMVMGYEKSEAGYVFLWGEKTFELALGETVSIEDEVYVPAGTILRSLERPVFFKDGVLVIDDFSPPTEENFTILKANLLK